MVDAALHALDADGTLHDLAERYLDPAFAKASGLGAGDPHSRREPMEATYARPEPAQPEGTAWELFVVVVVIIAAPVIVERLRIPGLIGLLVGGCIIGPEVLGIVSDTTGILHELGQVGLLYLMFLAGLELDLGVFARYRNQAIGFTALTFLAPRSSARSAG